ncbi:helix-turn-helix transcriptional regulator [Actinomadura miaoliensis]|uniref:HTH cro/C1-type domain-containing protein n=1 Tax=Actinomadura miaoliensis TaxID=430685 RepID=A0ABP7WF39_9ACTN
MTTADERRRIGALLQTERRRRRWSKPEMARRLAPHVPDQCPDRETLISYIKRWEAGKVSISERYQFAYAAALGTDIEELFGQKTAAGPAPLAAVDVLRLPHSNGRPADMEYVETLRETNQALVRLDALHGAGDVLPLAARVFRTANHKLATGAYVAKVERDLMAAAGETGEIAAWLAYDADNQAASRQVIHEALELSRAAGDRDMELFELGHLAMQSLHLHRPAEALRIADRALAGELPARVSALFEIRRGRALAQLGDESSALSAFAKAKNALSESISPRDPQWAWWVDETELTRHKAMAHAQLGQWNRTVPLREQVVLACRGEYLYGKLDLAQLLESLMQVRDWTRAEEVITDIAGIADAIAPGRTANLLRRIFAQIGRTEGVPSTVSDAAAYMRGVLETTTSEAAPR